MALRDAQDSQRTVLGFMPHRGRSVARPIRSLPGLLSLVAMIGVVALAAGTGVASGTSSRQTSSSSSASLPSSGAGYSRVTIAPVCRAHPNHPALPRLVKSDANPSSQLGSILSIARQPATGHGLAAVGPFDRYPNVVLKVFRRFVRIVDGEQHTRVAFFPAVVCNLTMASPPGSRPLRGRVAPGQAMVMVVLSDPPLHPAILAGDAATIRNGPALPGLGLTKGRGWLQATVVPDGVARVVMHFTPPFRHHYTATATIKHNIGIVVRKPDYSPTTVSWYAADGQLIHTFVDKAKLRYDQCLAEHKDCFKS